MNDQDEIRVMNRHALLKLVSQLPLDKEAALQSIDEMREIICWVHRGRDDDSSNRGASALSRLLAHGATPS